MKRYNFKRGHVYPLAIVGIGLLLFALNYKPGTYLIGWDNIMPEFNLWLNFKRSLFGVWQGYRGLGLPDGMSQTANLFHTIYVAILSIFLPQSLVRYAFIFLTHITGGLAFYFLGKYVCKNEKASFLGALFYMFNLGVVQMYFAPLEAFVVHFAAMPVLTLFLLRALDTPSRRNFLLLFVVSLLTSPQGFVPTVVFVGFLLIFFFLLHYVIATGKIKRVIIAGCMIVAANAFWILPYLYNGIHNASVIPNTKINQFSSEELFYKNYARGDLLDVVTMKGFMLDVIEYDHQTNAQSNFMASWNRHVQNPVYLVIYIGIAGIMAWGIYGIFKQKKKHLLPFLFGLVLGFVFLANRTPGFEQITIFMRTVSPLIGEVFRFPFTKFIIVYSFCFAVLFTFGLSLLLHRMKRYDRYIFAGLFAGLLFVALPAFQGNFVSSLLRLQLPNDYVQAFRYLDTLDENGRIAYFPVHTFWNWQFRYWGYRGSDFLWHGIKQPIMLRPFDPWSQYNEQFYNEVWYASNTQNCDQLHQVFNKYDIATILLDQSVVNTLSPQPINYQSLTSFLASCAFLSKQQAYGRVVIYSTDVPAQAAYQLSGNSTARVASDFFYGKTDPITQQFGNYVDDREEPNATYLFPSLFTEKLQSDVPFIASRTDKKIEIVPKQLPASTVTYGQLEIPSMFEHEFLIPIKLAVERNEIKLIPISPDILINNTFMIHSEPTISIKPRMVTNPTTVTFLDISHAVTLPQVGPTSYLINNFPNRVLLSNGRVEEIVVVDTGTVVRKSTIVPLPSSEIRSVKIVMDKVSSPFTIENILERQEYEVHRPSEEEQPFKNEAMGTVTRHGKAVTIETKSDTRELTFYLNNFFHQASYILFANVQNTSGLPMRFYVDNPFQKRAEVEAAFAKGRHDNIVVIPRTEDFYQGYGFHFIVKSVGREKAKATIDTINIYPFPIETLQHLRVLDTQLADGLPKPGDKIKTPVTKHNDFTYSMQPVFRNGSYVVLSQAYSTGWRAYMTTGDGWLTRYLPFIFGDNLPNHVRANSWANAWKVENMGDNTTVIMLFWPQYLAFAGLLLLLATPPLLLLIPKRRSKN